MGGSLTPELKRLHGTTRGRLFLHQDRLVAALKDVTHAGVGLAEALRIDAVELSHALGEIPVRGFHQQVVVLPIWQ